MTELVFVVIGLSLAIVTFILVCTMVDKRN
jgi:hypothetical protein